jgi:hypothetical protein
MKKDTKNATTEKAAPKKQPRKPAEAKKPAAPAGAVQEPAPAAMNTAPPEAKRSAPAAPRTPDPRLPAPGTVLQKRDRHGAVRCECTIEEGGAIRYAGKTYRSLSSAAMAAAKDLGLGGKTQNGFSFWGLSKPPRRPSDPLVTLERAWARYHGNVEALVKEGVTDENRSTVVATIRRHAQVIESLREKVA